tara:strand:- start:9463 stop:9795 length:333 start_codon:yes stop_codon:yes gene_type:complete
MFAQETSQVISEIITTPTTWLAAYTIAITTLAGVVAWLAFWVRSINEDYRNDLKKFIAKQSNEYQEVISHTTAAINTSTEVLRMVAGNQTNVVNSVQQLERTILTNKKND